MPLLAFTGRYQIAPTLNFINKMFYLGAKMVILVAFLQI